MFTRVFLFWVFGVIFSVLVSMLASVGMIALIVWLVVIILKATGVIV